jgi:hypothetical protein
MGDRSIITITTGASNLDTVSLYGHYAGSTNLEAVKAVLARPDARIGDIAYLTAQLFHQFATVMGNYDGGLGYGIFAGYEADEWLDNPTVIVNADTGEYCLEGEETQAEFARKGVNA